MFFRLYICPDIGACPCVTRSLLTGGTLSYITADLGFFILSAIHNNCHGFGRLQIIISTMISVFFRFDLPPTFLIYYIEQLFIAITIVDRICFNLSCI